MAVTIINITSLFYAGFSCNFHPYSDDSVYECDNGGCIHRSDRCNGMDDCGDGSDEGTENCG